MYQLEHKYLKACVLKDCTVYTALQSLTAFIAYNSNLGLKSYNLYFLIDRLNPYNSKINYTFSRDKTLYSKHPCYSKVFGTSVLYL